MLRIKSEKWNEFCQNAERLGFEEMETSSVEKTVGWNKKFVHIHNESERDKIEIIDTSDYERIDGSTIKQEDNYIFISVFEYSNIIDKLFDLIQLGYIEKI